MTIRPFLLLAVPALIGATAQATTFGQCLDTALEDKCLEVTAAAMVACEAGPGVAACVPAEVPMYNACIDYGETTLSCGETCDLYIPGVDAICDLYNLPDWACDMWQGQIRGDCLGACVEPTCVETCTEAAQVDEDICNCLGGDPWECEDFGQDSLGNCTSLCY